MFSVNLLHVMRVSVDVFVVSIFFSSIFTSFVVYLLLSSPFTSFILKAKHTVNKAGTLSTQRNYLNLKASSVVSFCQMAKTDKREEKKNNKEIIFVLPNYVMYEMNSKFTIILNIAHDPRSLIRRISLVETAQSLIFVKKQNFVFEKTFHRKMA